MSVTTMPIRSSEGCMQRPYPGARIAVLKESDIVRATGEASAGGEVCVLHERGEHPARLGDLLDADLVGEPPVDPLDCRADLGRSRPSPIGQIENDAAPVLGI